MFQSGNLVHSVLFFQGEKLDEKSSYDRFTLNWFLASTIVICNFKTERLTQCSIKQAFLF